MSFQNQENVLIRSVRSKRPLTVLYLPMYIAAVLLAVLFAFWMSGIVRNAEAAQVSLEKNLNSIDYLQEDGKLVITAEVNVSGKVVLADDFSFTMKDEKGFEVSTVKNDAKGLVVFEGISLAKAGKHVYYISEEPGALSDVEYDTTVYTVTVELVKLSNGLYTTTEKNVAIDGAPAEEIRFLNTFQEPIREAFWATLFFGIFCLFVPLVILVHSMIHRRLRRASIIVTEDRLKCRYGKKKKLDIALAQVRALSLDSDFLEAISFVYAGQRHTVRFIENRQEIFETIEMQQASALEEEAE